MRTGFGEVCTVTVSKLPQCPRVGVWVVPASFLDAATHSAPPGMVCAPLGAAQGPMIAHVAPDFRCGHLVGPWIHFTLAVLPAAPDPVRFCRPLLQRGGICYKRGPLAHFRGWGGRGMEFGVG
jgi:hypothetical protein